MPKRIRFAKPLRQGSSRFSNLSSCKNWLICSRRQGNSRIRVRPRITRHPRNKIALRGGDAAPFLIRGFRSRKGRPSRGQHSNGWSGLHANNVLSSIGSDSVRPVTRWCFGPSHSCTCCRYALLRLRQQLFRCAQVATDLVLVHSEYHHFNELPVAPGIKLQRLEYGPVLLLDCAIIGYHIERVRSRPSRRNVGSNALDPSICSFCSFLTPAICSVCSVSSRATACW